jgi:hypothetical protein
VASEMTNSAFYTTAEGERVPGLLVEGEHSLAFQSPGDGRVLFELPYRSIERVRMSFLRPSRMTLVGDGASHPLRLTGAVIDGEQHGESEWISGSSPTELEYDRTRRAAEETMILINGLTKVIEWVAADRVRRRRIRRRVAAKAPA